MKRLVILLAIVALLAAGVVGGTWLVRASPDQARQFLLDRGLEAQQADTLVSWAGGQPAASGQPEQPALRASGSIEGDEVAIVSEFAGRIVSITAGEGDEVQAGQALVALDPAQIEAQLAQAKAAVAAAEANLANVQAGTHPAQILAAQAAVQHAQAQRDAAQQAWDDAQALLNNPQDIDAQIAQAQASVNVAEIQIEQAQAQIKAAEVQRDRYQAQGSLEEKGLYRVYAYQVEAAEAALQAARANKTGADQTLAALQALRHNPLVLVGQVHLAEQQTILAETAVKVAEAKLAELEAGPAAEDIRLAETQIAKAQAAVSGLEVQLDKRTLRTPIDGIVTSQAAQAGEAAIAGTTLLTVADLDQLRLTVYIPENELGRVYLGQKVWVEVDSFPGESFAGTVAYISQEAEFTPKNVQTEEDRVNMVFAVRIHLPNPDRRLKPGMPADAILVE